MERSEPADLWPPNPADVVVIGSGVAALVAALAAHDAGSRVLVLERSETFGGTTAVSGGGIWMPTNHHMIELGVDDSREEALAYCSRLTAGRTPIAMLETFLDRGPAIVAGLEHRTPLRLHPMTWPDYHPEMEGAKSAGRMLEPGLHPRGAHTDKLRRAPILGLPMTLQESTADWRPAYFPERFDADAIKDRVANGLLSCGQALVGALLEAAAGRGIELRTQMRAVELTAARGCVTGVVVEHAPGAAKPSRRAIQARAVVLATGGYEWNAELAARHLVAPPQHPHSPPTAEGDGLLMAMEHGADLANMTEAWWYPAAVIPGEEYEGRPLARFVGTERTAPHSIMVNRFGQRFVNEAANYNDMQKAFFHFDANLYANRNLPCWAILDSRYRERYPVLTLRPGQPAPAWLPTADTLAGLATAVGIDPEGLTETVVRWNRMVADGRDRDFGRGDSAYDRFHGDPSAPHPNLGTVEQGPFFALAIHAGTVGTKGGPRIDEHGRVLHVRDRPIPGLFAAGNVAASPAAGAYFGGGTSIGMATVFGHLAGAAAAAHAAGLTGGEL